MRSHLLAAVAVIVPMTALPAPPADLADLVSGAGAKKHLAAFQAIAERSGGNRAAGTPGYRSSADYVAGRMRSAGYRVTSQQFTYPYFRETAKPRLRSGTATYLASTVHYSPAGAAKGTATRPAGHGCADTDYQGFQRGRVALVRRGECTFGVKARHAEAAGAAAMIVVNSEAGLPDATLGGPGVTGIPVIGVAKNSGDRLAGKPVRIRVKAESGVRVTTNVIAETAGGRADRVVMLGAHLDSVKEGPGINDNGSGSAALLEIAEKLATTTKPANKVRFAWWGAEELGLLGSHHYVSALSAEERKSIALYLNFDMIASKNFVYGIYDGDDSDKLGAGAGPAGSDLIEKDFEAYFKKRGLPYTGADFSGRSDYGPFIAVGIPAGGLFTGAEGLKSQADARRFGGTAGKPYDPCYHKACDTSANINDTALDVNTDAIATVLARYAQSLPKQS